MQILAIELKRSRRFLWLAAGIHSLAGLAVVVSGLPLALKLAALLATGLSCLIFIGSYRRSLQLCSSISYHDDIASQKRKSSENGGWIITDSQGSSQSGGAAHAGDRGWIITDGQGRRQEATLREHNILLDFYISLVFITKSKSRKLYVPLLRADLSEENFRALKVLLRYSVD